MVWRIFGFASACYVNIDGIHRSILHDPEVYPDPERFMPERFLKDGKLNPEVQDPMDVIFGLGRR